MPDGTKTAPGIRWHDEERDNFNARRVIAGHFRDLDKILENMTAGLRLIEGGRINTAAIERHLTEVPFELGAIKEAFHFARTRGDGYLKLVIVP
jgi:hypothetical protein